jgi:ATP-dependent Lhr-like helicase
MVYLGPPPGAATALATLSEAVRLWFRQRFPEPTPAQRLAWPALAAGQNLLLAAPTGSGKTLAAFLPVLDRLLADRGPRLSQPCHPPGLRCLAIAPLKALSQDLRTSLRSLARDLHRAGAGTGARLRIGLRTGDTSAATRRHLFERPPAILVTTPESLAVLLTQPPAPELFAGLDWLVVDEVHALAGNKRGADLALSLERVEALAAGGAPGHRLQRIGLSATCSPLDVAGRFLAGTGRPCAIAQVADDSPLQMTIEPLELDDEGVEAETAGSGGPSHARGFLGRLVDRLEPELRRNRTTLVFTNVRALAERLVWSLRRRFPDWAEQVAVHHSSLSGPRRRRVEHRLKQGRLRAVVSSTSLELGIDIGTVDGVVLVHPPGGVVRLLQRVGRAGHGPGRVRRGLVLTSGPAELLEAAVTAGASSPAQCEPLRAVDAPLDVLCQQLLGMAVGQPRSPDETFALARRAYPYRSLARADLDRCLDYLSGRRSDGRPWLPARLGWHGDTFTVVNDRTARIVRRNLGTILTEETRPVRLAGGRSQESGVRGQHSRDSSSLTPDSCLLTPDSWPPAPALVGHVDESFADRLEPGDRFLLDGRCFQYQRRDGTALLVEEVAGRPRVPRWSGGGWPLSAELAERLFLLRVRAAEALREGAEALAALLRDGYALDGRSAAALANYFQRQEAASEIPDPGTCLVETVPDEGGVAYYLHTPLNRSGNDALARVAVRRLARRQAGVVPSLVADLGLALFFRGAVDLPPPEWRALLSAEGFEADLEEALTDSDTLRERFRGAALTGLMLLRHPLGKRPRVGGTDWAQRRLFEKVRADDPGCVLLRQAWREVREECCDAAAALTFVRQLPRLAVRRRLLAEVSPFARGWTQAAPGPLETVETPAEALRRLHEQLVGGSDGMQGGWEG